eukprot:2168429-Pleurochrysis_carterae.AAC.3
MPATAWLKRTCSAEAEQGCAPRSLNEGSWTRLHSDSTSKSMGNRKDVRSCQAEALTEPAIIVPRAL